MTENEFLLVDRIQKIKSINEQYDLENNSCLSLSGGKDSTVLHYLIDEALPGNKIPRVFLNTGIEYKLIYIYVQNMAKNDDRIKILNVGKNIKETLEKVGYPFKSKEHSQKVYEYRKGYRNESVLKYFHQISNGYQPCPHKLMYQIKEPYNLNISNLCCYEFKKLPFKNWLKENNRSITLTGMRNEEGGARANLGCIVIKDNKLKKFHPLMPLTENWLNWFIESRKIKLCNLYYPPYNLTRTGCKGCPFSLSLEKDLFMMKSLLPVEAKQCELIWKPVYDEYRRIGYRLNDYPLFDF